MAQVKGKVAQIIGPVVDVSFDTAVAPLPNIYDSLEISKDDGSQLVLEVQSHIGEDQVRTISMDSTAKSIKGVGQSSAKAKTQIDKLIGEIDACLEVLSLS